MTLFCFYEHPKCEITYRQSFIRHLHINGIWFQDASHYVVWVNGVPYRSAKAIQTYGVRHIKVYPSYIVFYWGKKRVKLSVNETFNLAKEP